MNRKPATSPEAALASEVFDQLCAAGTLKAILGHHRHLCDILKIKPTNFPQFYPKLRSKLSSWKAQALWNKFDKRASHKCYNRGKACSQNKVLIIGAGPCGLRTAIEAQLLGARVVVVEKRDRITRNNVLHLWPFVIQDLRGLGAKKFFGKFCAGAIDHISIRQLQCILLKVALILGVEIHEGVAFEELIPPPVNQEAEKTGWRARVSPADHPVAQYELDVLIGADGKRNTLEGFKRKEFRGKLAIAITANFINRRTEAEARVQEISGVAFIFNQKFFKDLYCDTGIDLENIVYYKDDTHYFVMTAKKHSLIDKGVILQDFADTFRLLDPANVDKEALLRYAKEAADFSTNYMLPDLDFAVNHYGQPDVAMFDFTSMYAAENASRVVERHGHKLLQMLVGDSLLEPFWPTGSGCARGFLSSMDACWVMRNWAVNGALSPLEVIAERESIYRLLGQTTPENLQRDLTCYTLDPHSRYPNLNTGSVLPLQVRNLFETDDPVSMELALTPTTTQEVPKKRRRRDSQVHPDTLLHWLKRQVCLHPDLHVDNMTYSFRSGLVLCAIVSRYRPDLLDFATLAKEDVVGNNQRAFDILDQELGIPPLMTGQEMAESECPDRLTMLSYLSQVYDAFRGEIPHIKHPRLSQEQQEEEEPAAAVKAPRAPRKRHSAGTRPSNTPAAPRAEAAPRKGRKRRSGTDKLGFGGEERQKRVDEIDQNRRERQERRREARRTQTEQFKKSLAMMACSTWRPEGEDGEEGFDDYSLYVYRQTAPEFQNRVKELEMKLLYPDRESRLRAELRNKKAEDPDEDFTGRIKDIEEKLMKGSGAQMQKKPRDLLRAIGKIDKTDWNVKEIEKKIEENKFGRGVTSERPEKVPKWSRQQFDDKFQAMERKLINKGLDQETASRYAEVDITLKRLEQKLKDGSTLETGMRGCNKVSAMAEQFAVRGDDQPAPLMQSSSKGSIGLPLQPATEKCHFCDKRVYLMERVNAEGKVFHRSCFKCEYCGSTLRVGNYMFDREGKYGNRFFCNQHFGLPGTMKQRATKTQERNSKLLAKQRTPEKPLAVVAPTQPSPLSNKLLRTPPTEDLLDRGATPERIEFENLAEPDLAEDAPSEMDEDEWTDRNFGASCAEGGSSDDLLELTDSEEGEEEEEEAEAVMDGERTRQVAEQWTRRHEESWGHRGSDQNGQDSCEADDSDDLDDLSEDDESDTATEGEEDLRALELRKQEVRLQPQRHRNDTDTGSDTEVASDDRTSTDETSEELNSATEISTDSEFEHDGTTPTRHEIPDILITDHHARRKPEEPRRVQVKAVIRSNRAEERGGVKLQFSPLVDTRPTDVLAKNAINARPMPFINPRRGDYLLSKTQSTEGIATKMSLELRKKYLLGNPAASNAIAKSGSATALDSRFKTFASTITECQKLLNPGAEISPTMQAFLQTSGKARPPPTSPTINTPPLNLPPTSMIFRKQKELPEAQKDFVHVCGKPAEVEKLNVLNENVRNETKPTSEHRKQDEGEGKKQGNDENKENEEVKEGLDCRPRSPAHETSILVPQIPWAKDKALSDSLSETDTESESSSLEEEGKAGEVERQERQDRQPPPPRLEIRNSRGELMDEDGFEMDSLQVFENNEGHSPMSMARQIELARTKISELKSSIAQGEDEIHRAVQAAHEEGAGDPPHEAPVSLHRDLLRNNSLTLSLSKERSPEDSVQASVPSSPDESCHTFAALTETELSDWARDGDMGVSEDLEDVEEQINKEDVKKQKRSKTAKKPKSLELPAGQFSHVCGKTDPKLRKMLASTENLDFMDTDASEMESMSATNDALLENRGYFRFVNEEEAATPVVENGLEPTKDSSTSSSSQDTSSCSSASPPKPVECPVEPREDATTEESTTSEQTTIKNSPACNKNFDINDETFYSPLIDMSPISPHPVQVEDFVKSLAEGGKDTREYEDYVQRLQGRISPFHNVRDSIDYRKSKQKVEKETRSEEPIKEEEEKSGEGDQTTKKLRELSRERTLQKDLVHEMVMKKLMNGKKSPGERKGKRLSRSASGVVVSPTKPPEAPPPPGLLDGLQVPFADTSPENETLPTLKRLPDTPLTNPDAFKTPVAPPRDKRVEKQRPDSAVERERIREDARARARLKSDEELGLSPEDRIRMLRDKANKILETPVASSPEAATPKRPQNLKTSKSENAFETPKKFDSRIKYLDTGRKGDSLLAKSSSTSKVFDKLRGIDRAPMGAKAAQKSTSDLTNPCPEGPATEAKSSGSSGPSTSSSSTPKPTGPPGEAEKTRSRDRERRRSIIQAVSDFFHKKSPSSPPPKSPSSPSKPDKFSAKFKLTAKSKDKKDSPDGAGAAPIVTPPPVPPPPLSYKPQGVETEESCSEGDDGLSAISTPTQGSTVSVDASSRRARMTKRMARQAQLKRLRMAQEIQRRLEEVEEKQKELETRGVALEKALRGEMEGEGPREEADLLRSWFDLVRERNELRRYEKELLVRAQEMELEDRHARLQQDLRDRLAKDDASKSQEEVVQEGVILREMLDTVEKRDALTALLEQERQRYQEEDKDLEAQMLSKGLRLTPIRKYEYQSAV